MLLISKTYATITPEYAELGDFASTGFEFEQVSYTFKELVDELRNYSHLSQHPVTTKTVDFGLWVSTDFEIDDYTTMEQTEYSLHFCRDNGPKKLKYWAKALLAAGLIKQ